MFILRAVQHLQAQTNPPLESSREGTEQNSEIDCVPMKKDKSNMCLSSVSVF